MVHSVLAVFISKEPRPSRCWRRGINISGVDFWHAVEFSRNGRFLCTHPLGLSSGQFPFGLAVLRFRLYQTVSGSDFLGAFQVSASAFPFPAVPTLSEVLSRNFHPVRAAPGASVAPGSPLGGAVNVLERGAPMQIEGPRSSRALTEGQTSTTTGRIIGLRR